MAWLTPDPSHAFDVLGKKEGDTYVVNENCLSTLEHILQNLLTEDCHLRLYRRAIGSGQNTRNDLIPVLINTKNNKIVDTVIKILLNLTLPIESLFPTLDSLECVARATVLEMNHLLTTSKEAFSDTRSTRAVVDRIKSVCEKESSLDVDECECINNCLLLLRNILHIPNPSALQNGILWNLFTHSIDKIVLHLLSCPQKIYWSATMVQLIALMYKDQHVGTLQKLLSQWFEASLSESSEDNESNTSPQLNQGSDDSSPAITSDPTSDSSDNGGIKHQQTKVSKSWSNASAQSRTKAFASLKRNKSTETDTSMGSSVDSGISDVKTAPKPAPIKETDSEATEQNKSVQNDFSDCGYGTQAENRGGESISTSSNDDDQPREKIIHHKPMTKARQNSHKNRSSTQAVDKKELRRKKLVKRSKVNKINMKGLMHHSSTDEDIMNVLKEFTVDFLLKGYDSLVRNLHLQLLGSGTGMQFDTSHFFWLVTYFLKFAAQLELDCELVSHVLSYDIISYLVFQGVWLYEELETGLRVSGTDLKPILRRLHLLVTAIREFLQSIETYEKLTHLSEEDVKSLQNVKVEISKMEHFRNLFLLLLRQYNPDLQSKQYLQDVIVTNHIYLLLLDNASNSVLPTSIMEHMKEFATPDIMYRYGLLLDDYKRNGAFVNDCVFTVMHHVVGDVGDVSSLFQPSVLSTFAHIWETDYQICDDWSDVVEYVMHSFVNAMRSGRNIPETVAGNGELTGSALVTNDVYLENKWVYQANDILRLALEGKTDASADNKRVAISDDNMEVLEEVLDEVDILIGHHKGAPTIWLQKALLEACHAKLLLSERTDGKAEPIAYHYALLNLPTPLVTWKQDQISATKRHSFILLLHKLGLILPSEVGKVFVRIPNFWTANHLYSIAERLGPVQTDELKFDVRSLRRTSKTHEALAKPLCTTTHSFTVSSKHMPSYVRYTPFPNSMQWSAVQAKSGTATESKSSKHHLSIQIPPSKPLILVPDMPPPDLYLAKPAQTVHMDCDDLDHNSDTASVASNLTRMCVSDEDEKSDH